MTGHASTSRVLRWYDQSRTLDRFFGWLDEKDLRRARRNTQRVKAHREAARMARDA